MSVSDTSSVTPSSVPGMPDGLDPAGGAPHERQRVAARAQDDVDAPWAVGCTAPTSTVQNRGLIGTSSSPISSRSAAWRSSIWLRRRSIADGMTPAMADDRIVWRTSPVVAAASTPCPHTSPTAMIHQLASAWKAS